MTNISVSRPILFPTVLRFPYSSYLSFAQRQYLSSSRVHSGKHFVPLTQGQQLHLCWESTKKFRFPIKQTRFYFAILFIENNSKLNFFPVVCHTTDSLQIPLGKTILILSDVPTNSYIAVLIDISIASSTSFRQFSSIITFGLHHMKINKISTLIIVPAHILSSIAQQFYSCYCWEYYQQYYCLYYWEQSS